ncbi:exopolyphosphatase [[Candida] railenensis]|uniref:Exopolyphosphatase n=1 Tax=[Candida] railenensis TaxID=45579 RepID=A0A9P0QK16_9ASCO|nr:exopolyphosphatase [[Candida] railenensis]
MSVRSFLTSLKSLVDSGALLKSPLKFVTGNQSADLDSVISAISYSYFTNLKDSSEHVIPLINIPREDLRLRRDIVSVLKAHSINEDLLYFVEDFSQLIKRSKAPSQLILVDHCNLQGDEVTDAYNAKLLKIVAIIDHHADEQIALDANPRIIQVNGSCSSLVFNYWYNQIGKPTSFYTNNDVISLLLAPLLIDTTNMTAKVENEDTIAFKKYGEILLSTDNTSFNILKAYALPGAEPQVEFDIFESFYKQVKTQKKNIEGFSMKDFLRKDYKQFEFHSKTSGSTSRIGFSSLSKPFSWILKNYTKAEIIKACTELRSDNNLDVNVMTTSYTRKDNGLYAREFAYCYNSTNSNAELYAKLPEFCTVLDLHSDDLYSVSAEDLSALNTFQSNEVLILFNQHNTQASRKQVVPAVKEAIETN